MDEIDDAILRELQKDGRKSMAELGSMLGIAPSTVFKRIEKLKKAGIIERFTIVINQKCFENTLIAFLNIRVSRKRSRTLRSSCGRSRTSLTSTRCLSPATSSPGCGCRTYPS